MFRNARRPALTQLGALAVLLSALLATPAQALDASDELTAIYADMRAASAPLQATAAALSRDAGRRAGAPALEGDALTRFEDDLADFSRLAARASYAIKSINGPVDLGCIYAGMAADSDTRLGALRTADRALDQARILAGIADLMRDAVEVTPSEPGPEALSESAALATSAGAPACQAATVAAPIL